MEMPNTPPPAEAPYKVLCVKAGGYNDGLYPIESLYKFEAIPKHLQPYATTVRPLEPTNMPELLRDANVALIHDKADVEQARSILASEFEQIRKLNDVILYARRH